MFELGYILSFTNPMVRYRYIDGANLLYLRLISPNSSILDFWLSLDLLPNLKTPSPIRPIPRFLTE